MTERKTRVSDVQRWWEYVYGYEWRFYDSDDDRPTDAERCDQLISDLVERDDENYGTRRGTNVHAALEEVATGIQDGAEINGIKTPEMEVEVQTDYDLVLPVNVAVEEKLQQKRYGDVLVAGTADLMSATQILDWKTSAYDFKFTAYYRSLQWRFYLDMTGRDHFRYIGLRIRNPLKRRPDVYRLTDINEFDCYAYAGMNEELTDKVERFADFVDRECPEYWDIDIYPEEVSDEA